MGLWMGTNPTRKVGFTTMSVSNWPIAPQPIYRGPQQGSILGPRPSQQKAQQQQHHAYYMWVPILLNTVLLYLLRSLVKHVVLWVSTPLRTAGTWIPMLLSTWLVTRVISLNCLIWELLNLFMLVMVNVFQYIAMALQSFPHLTHLSTLRMSYMLLTLLKILYLLENLHLIILYLLSLTLLVFLWRTFFRGLL